MLFQCFRAPGSEPVGAIEDDRPRPPRPSSFSAAGRKSSRYIKRLQMDCDEPSSQSAYPSTFQTRMPSNRNGSIAKLPHKRDSDPKVEAMMMPLPPFGPDHRPSKCLRLSYPKMYGNIVSDMKAAKGCRDWRNFAVFPNDDVDMSITADEAARQRALDYQRKLRQLESSFEWSPGSSSPGSSSPGSSRSACS